MHLAGVLHDIGKIGISDPVLTSPARSTTASGRRSARIRRSAHGSSSRPEFADLASGSSPTTSAPTAGLPARAARGQIPLEARILAVADAFEAMTADRLYRAALGGRRPGRARRRGRHAVRRGRRGRVPARARLDPPAAPAPRGLAPQRIGATPVIPRHFRARRSAARASGCVDSRNSGFSDADW